MNNMIIVKNETKCNIKIINNIKKLQKYYDDIVDSINFDELECPDCHGHSWAIHSTYTRSVDIFKRAHKITITRIICRECGKTHAILIEDIIPYSIVGYEIIVDVCLNVLSIVSSHDFFIKHKYKESSLGSIFDYETCCLMNCRGHTCFFVESGLSICT